jgi:putative redox protein
MRVQADWAGGMAFDVATGSGHVLRIDARAEAGGNDTGARPKELLLAALAGCTAMDVASILRKMRQPVRSLSVRAEGEETDEHPRAFRSIDLTYEVEGEGEGLDPQKVARAVELSQERYCGVSAMLRPAVDLRVRLVVAGAPVPLPDGGPPGAARRPSSSAARRPGPS